MLVLDWGIARRIGEPENDADSEKKETKKPVGATLDGIIRGTPEYMSPEQAAALVRRLAREGQSLSDAAKQVAKETGYRKGELYRLALESD